MKIEAETELAPLVMRKLQLAFLRKKEKTEKVALAQQLFGVDAVNILKRINDYCDDHNQPTD